MTKSQAQSPQKRPPRGWRIAFILWLTMLAYGIPEVTAGTGRLWIITPGAYIMALPLYAVHFMIFVQIALRIKRTSWPALYLFGVIFGLYETWLTKVVWAGYVGTDGFAFGSIGPWFGVHETLGLILFFHAVISFLLPLAVLTRLIPAWGEHFPTPNWVFGTGKWGVLRRLVLLIILGFVTGHNNPVVLEYLITWLPFLAILILGGLVLRRTGAFGPQNARSTFITSPYLSRFGTLLCTLWLVALYIVAFQFMRPEDIPPPGILLITAALYLPLILLILRTQKRVPPKDVTPQSAALPMLWLGAVFLFGLTVVVLAQAGIGFGGLLAVPVFVGMVPLGAGIFLWLGLWRGLIRGR